MSAGRRSIPRRGGLGNTNRLCWSAVRGKTGGYSWRRKSRNGEDGYSVVAYDATPLGLLRGVIRARIV